MTFQYWLGFWSGRFAQIRKRCNAQYLRGYLSGVWHGGHKR